MFLSDVQRAEGRFYSTVCNTCFPHPANSPKLFHSPPSVRLQVVVPTRVGQVYVYDSVKPDQDEYDVPPRHQPPAQQDIYDVPPTRQQYNAQVRTVCVCECVFFYEATGIVALTVLLCFLLLAPIKQSSQ